MLSETSKLILGIIGKQLENGDEKGRKEYGVSIDDAEDVKYKWNMEAMAEMADALKYQQKEIQRLNERKIFHRKNAIHNHKLKQKFYADREELKKENEFLKQRNKELRQKPYIQVYDENLKLIEELKSQKEMVEQMKESFNFTENERFKLFKENEALKHENQVKFNDLVKYEKTIEQLRKELMQVGAIADKYYQDAIRLNEENNKLNGVIGSVQTFIGQFAK